jgi:energy-coupling factor transporter ATP-binding protein EcfA2
MEALKMALLGGIKVKILFPGKYDHFTVYYASRTYLAELVKCGAEVYLYKNGLYSSKGAASAIERMIRLEYSNIYYEYNKELIDTINRIAENNNSNNYFHIPVPKTSYINEAMNYIADLKDVSRIGRKEKIEELLNAVHLVDKKSTLIRKLSGGMKQRLGIAQSLLGNSDLIIMDEPTVGLDPTERLNFRNLLTRYAFNKTIIISSHIISDISTMCSNMAVMKHGHILYAGSTQAFIHTMDNKIFSIEVESESSIPQEIEDNVITIIQKETAIEVRYFINDINICKNSIMSLPTLEDAYFYLIKSIGGNL